MKRSYLIAILIGMFAAVGGGAILLFPTETGIETEVNANGQEPRIAIGETSIDVGRIKVADTVEREFIVENEGEGTLVLTDINSSCGCTTATIKIGDKESREFGMHARGQEKFSVAAGEKATVRVIYRPYTMPVSGPVQREVYIKTNDSKNSRLVLRMTAVVEK